MRSTRLLLIYIVCSPVLAFAGNTDYARRLLRAKSAREVGSLQKNHEEMQIAHRACKLQLNERSAPLACYDSLSLEIKSGLHPNPGHQLALRSKLDRLCAEAAKRLQVPRRIPASISASCRHSLAQADRVRKYREGRPEWSEN